MKISLDRHLMRAQGPAKGLIERGVSALAMGPDGSLLIGGGTGLLSIASTSSEHPKIPIVTKHQVAPAAITSISGAPSAS